MDISSAPRWPPLTTTNAATLSGWIFAGRSRRGRLGRRSTSPGRRPGRRGGPIGLGAALMSLWSEDCEHLVPLHPGPHFHFADVSQIVLQLFQDAGAQFAVRHLAPAKPDRSLNFVAFRQPLARVLHAIAVIVLVRAGAKLNFLDGDDHLLLLRLVRFLLGQVLKFAVVNDLANWRLGVWRDLDQIHASFSRGTNGVTSVHDPELFTVFGNYSHLGHANTFVNTSDGRPAKIGTTTASETCSYCCTSSVKRFSFQVPSFKFEMVNDLKPETCNSKLLIGQRARLD